MKQQHKVNLWKLIESITYVISSVDVHLFINSFNKYMNARHWLRYQSRMYFKEDGK